MTNVQVFLNTRFSHPSVVVPVAKGPMPQAAKSLLILAVTTLLGQATLAGAAQAGASRANKRAPSAAAPHSSQPSPTRLVDVTFRTPRYGQTGTNAKALRRGDGRDTAAASSAAPVLVYLNAGGSVITGGADNPARNTSWIASSAGGDVRFPAYSGSARSWQAITACVRDVYRDFAVDFTDQRPNGTGYSMIVVGGSPALLGLNNQVGGIAPSDSEVLRNAVGFVFSASSGNRVNDLCEAIVHEVGHTLGLDHAYRCEDPMSYLNGCGPKRFADVAAPCGEYEARSCDGGAATQNSYRTLMSLVGGRSNVAPVAPPVLPPVVDDRDTRNEADSSDPSDSDDDSVVDPYYRDNQDDSDVDTDTDANEQVEDGWDVDLDNDAATVDFRSEGQTSDTPRCPNQQTSSSQPRHPRAEGRSNHRGSVTQTVRVTRVTRLWMRDRSGAWQLVSVRTR